MAKGSDIVCGDVPFKPVTWQVELKQKRDLNLLSRCFEDSKTAFGAFQLASSKLGNPAFSDVVCNIVEERDKPAEPIKSKSKRRRKI